MSTSKEESVERIGTVVDQKWRLDALIGYSPVAATYRATNRYGLDVAVKVVHRAVAELPEVVDRFLHEAELANRIAHPSTPRVYDDGVTEDGCPFVLMDLTEGESLELRRVSLGGRLRLGEARPIFDGLLDALVAVHAAGVIHRNLRPGTVFLARDGRVLLPDLGAARTIADEPRSRRTLDSPPRGSAAFMAPELARGRRHEIDERADIWSLGAIFFTVLTGRRVHGGATPQEKLAAARAGAAPPIATVLPGIHPDLANVIDRALAKDRDARWASAAEMRRAYWRATGRPEPPHPSLSRVSIPALRASSRMSAGVATDSIFDVDPTGDALAEALALYPPSVDAFVAVPRPRERPGAVRTIAVAVAIGLGVATAALALAASAHDPPRSHAE